MAEYGAPAARAATGALGSILSRQRPVQPELSVIIMSDIPVVHPHVRSVEPFSNPDTELLGYPALTLHAATVAITNTGQVALLAENFDKPLRIEFRNNPTAIVQVVVRWRRHDQVDPVDSPINIHQSTDASGVTLTPPIINPGDGFVVQFLTVQLAELDVDVRCRYPGLEKIEVMRFAQAQTNVTYDNTDVVAREVSWVNLRKFFPQRMKYRRAAQLKELVNQLTNWSE